MKITARGLNRATLARQLLLRRESLGVADTVRRLVALQAQQATAFHRLPDEAWRGLAAEARSLVTFLADREPQVYRRYGHWWSKLPSTGARLLPVKEVALPRRRAGRSA